MEKIKMKANLRKDKGTIACKQLRKKKMIPGVIYKGGVDGVMITLEEAEVLHAFSAGLGENSILTLEMLDGAKKLEPKTVIIQEIQSDPLKDKVIHVDFHEISLTEIIRIKVPVHIKGTASGVTSGGVLNLVMWEIEVECMAMDKPESFTVDITNLNINDALYVKDLKAINGVTVKEDTEKLLLSINPPHTEEAAPVEEGLASEVESEPELIKKGKKDEEGEGEESEKPKEKAK
ncbi:MAG: 50S ribosomal protein L25 [Candidatus Omnitrophica bacterium]|nr:50S ribosomal protein L25 [Candidatus Omnitrophota bacterium]